ncbi:MAG: phosphoenolpyruvate carboxylase, partial [Coriobacteriia bacterium]|nr:phosphoenolpyruvate carboxylase [Coriobacteriia bacterium]
GLPPELIAFDALTQSELAFVHEAYPSFEAKVSEALRFTDFEGPLMTSSLRASLERAGHDFETHEEHLELVRRMRIALDESDTTQLTDLVSRAAILRRFLG